MIFTGTHMNQNTEQMTTEQILLNLEAHIHNYGKKIPIMGKMILADDVLSFVHNALKQLAEDFKEADTIIRTSDSIIESAQAQANQILLELQETIETTDIALAAKAHAEEKMYETEQRCNARLEEVEMQADSLLQDTQNVCNEMINESQHYTQNMMEVVSQHLNTNISAMQHMLSEVNTQQQHQKVSLADIQGNSDTNPQVENNESVSA